MEDDQRLTAEEGQKLTEALEHLGNKAQHNAHVTVDACIVIELVKLVAKLLGLHAFAAEVPEDDFEASAPDRADVPVEVEDPFGDDEEEEEDMF